MIQMKAPLSGCCLPSFHLTSLLPIPPPSSSSFCPSGLPPMLPPQPCSPGPALWLTGVSPGCRAKPAASRMKRTAFMVTGRQWWRGP